MALATYADLQTSVGAYLNRADLTAVIPDFITLAEAQISRRLRDAWAKGFMLPRKMVGRSDATLSTEFLAVPTDFLGPLAMIIASEAVKLRYVKPDTLLHLKAERGEDAVADTPQVYSVVGEEFQFIPVPDTSYTLELTYWKRPVVLSASNTSNWILADHPDVYLYGSLVHSAPYLIDDPRIATWETLFGAAIEELLRADPLPNDGSLLRADLAITFRPHGMTNFDIVTGDFR